MRLQNAGICTLVVLISTGIFSAATLDTEQSFMVHQVKKGESVSLICIDYYGHYSAAMGNAVKKDNPGIKDINLIFKGQNIKFRKPVNPDTVQTPVSGKEKIAATVKPDSLFIKKMAVIQGVVTYVEGAVQYKLSGQNDFNKLNVNTILNPGDIIQTASNGRIELIINRESVVRLRENTRMVLEEFRDAEKTDDKTRIGFSVGTIWTKMKKFKDRISRFELELPTAIAAVHGTVYQTTINSDSSSEVKVFSGEVAVSGSSAESTQPAQVAAVSEITGPQEVAGPEEVNMESWIQIVRAMQKITIDKKGSPSKPASFNKDADSEWEKWNEERDKRIAQMFMEL